METLVVFGVGLGNLGRFARKRMKAATWVDQLNAALADDLRSVRVLATFGHTGNFVVQSVFPPEVVRRRLTKVLDTDCVVMRLATLIVTAISKLRQTASSGFRYTPRAAMLVFGNPSGRLPKSTERAKYIKLTSAIVLVLKRDALTPDGSLDRNRRSGEWGGVVGEIGRALTGGGPLAVCARPQERCAEQSRL